MIKWIVENYYDDEDQTPIIVEVASECYSKCDTRLYDVISSYDVGLAKEVLDNVQWTTNSDPNRLEDYLLQVIVTSVTSALSNIMFDPQELDITDLRDMYNTLLLRAFARSDSNKIVGKVIEDIMGRCWAMDVHQIRPIILSSPAYLTPVQYTLNVPGHQGE